MKAIRIKKKGYTGLIPDHETFNKFVDGELDWRWPVKDQLIEVTIPYDLFRYFVELHKEELARTSVKSEMLGGEKE